jgi:hypothetical protein
MPLDDVTIVEEAESGIFGEGWDNLLLKPGCEELPSTQTTSRKGMPVSY